MLASDKLTFYTVSDARYFLGTVGLVNSLRLTGHDGVVVVLDCGLTPEQKDILSSQCHIVDSKDISANPQLLKPFPYLLNPTGTIAIIDSDIIVTRSLLPLANLADNGKICAYPDITPHRWCDRWQELFALKQELRHQPYITTGLVIFSTVHWSWLLERWWQVCQQIPPHRTNFSGGTTHDDPLAWADQDALNALMMSEIPQTALVLSSPLEVPEGDALKQVKVINARTLACTYQGQTTTLLHAVGAIKPWEAHAWKTLRRNSYVRLLQRVLAGGDVAIEVPPQKLPIWLRTGIFSPLSLSGLDVFNKITKQPVLKQTRSLAKQIISSKVRNLV